MRYRILPYRQGSKGAKALATGLGGRVLKLEGSTFVPKHGDTVINWGSVIRPDSLDTPTAYLGVSFLNEPQIIKNASNKLMFFQAMEAAGHDSIIPQFWTSKDQIPDDAFPVVCRTVLAGHSGDGIVIAATRDDLVSAPLYVRYVKKQDEFRVHVGLRSVNGETTTTTISLQRKARRLDCPNPNWQVRNHQNGFIYVRNEVTAPASVQDVAHTALLASGLDFGAVDVIWNEQQNRAYVLEINTAPGLEGTTVDDYVKFFKA